MGDPRRVRPDEVEILVTRELRKAGLDVVSLRRGSLIGEATDYALSLVGTVRHEGDPRRLGVEFRNQAAPVSSEELDAFAHDEHGRFDTDAPKRLAPPDPDRSDTPPLRVMVSTAGFALDAARQAQTLGITLLAIADGPAAFRRSQWSMGEQTPAWVPEYMAERVDIARDGTMRRELLVGTSANRRADR